MSKAFAELVDPRRPFSGGVDVCGDFENSRGVLFGHVPEDMRTDQAANADNYGALAIQAGETSSYDRIQNLIKHGDVYAATKCFAELLDRVDLNDPDQAAFVADLGWDLAQSVSYEDLYLAREIVSTLDETFTRQGLSLATTMLDNRIGPVVDLGDGPDLIAILAGSHDPNVQTNYHEQLLAVLDSSPSAHWVVDSDLLEQQVVPEERNARQLYELAEKRRIEASTHVSLTAAPAANAPRFDAPKPGWAV